PPFHPRSALLPYTTLFRSRVNQIAHELDNARKEIAALRDRVEELKKPPERIEDLDERMQRTVELAETQAAEILARAEAAAEKNRSEEHTSELQSRGSVVCR